MRKVTILYVILGIMAGVSVVMLPLQAFGTVEESRVPAPMLAAQAEKRGVDVEGESYGSETSLIQNLYDVGIILSVGFTAALIVSFISKRHLIE